MLYVMDAIAVLVLNGNERLYESSFDALQEVGRAFLEKFGTVALLALGLSLDTAPQLILQKDLLAAAVQERLVFGNRLKQGPNLLVVGQQLLVTCQYTIRCISKRPVNGSYRHW